MKTLPLSGRVSTVTTGIFFASSCASVGAMAAVSCGAIARPLTPWLMNVCALAVSLATSFCELVVLSERPSSLAYCGVYLMYEFQKSVSERG